MNPHYEQQLEASVRRELDALGELPAPPALANQILRAIEQRATTPWYRRTWPGWPLGLRLASLAVLLGVCGGLCFAIWESARSIASLETTSGWFADAQALWRTFGVLHGVANSLFNQLSTGLLVTGLALVFAICVVCIGLGSACVRLALRPATNRI